MKPLDQKNKPLTTGQVANYCGVTLRTVINWINKGLLKSHQLPGTRRDNRILPQDMVAFMVAHHIPIPDEYIDLSNNAEKMALVVDDNILFAKSLKRLLKRLNYTVSIAHDGFEAGLIYARIKPRLVTLDIQMPRLDGFAVLEKLQHPHSSKIIVISGMDNKSLNEATKSGADAVFPKPFDEEQLVKAIAS